MKKLNMEASDENVLKTIADDKLKRTNDVKSIIDILETIDYNAFISLDGAWGEGKTFLVRQVEKTLSYHYKEANNQSVSDEEKAAFTKNTVLAKLDLNNTYLPIYFNAWEYDNNDDPLMALIFVVVKASQKYLSTKINVTSLTEKLTSFVDSVNLSIGNIGISANFEGIRKAFSKKDILSSVRTAEETKECVKEILDELIVEETQKLVVFIDELDRCKPSFAIEMLERIKHYYNDERIIFIISVNKSQLIHTIANYYGSDFDASKYLNKFFDINFQLPPVNIMDHMYSLGIILPDNWVVEIANELQKMYNLSLRDSTIYFQKIDTVSNIIKTAFERQKVMLIMVPILSILDIVDLQKKKSVLDGNGLDVLISIIEKNEFIRSFIVQFSGKRENDEDSYKKGLETFKNMYLYAFSQDFGDHGYNWQWDIGRYFKGECIRICNMVD